MQLIALKNLVAVADYPPAKWLSVSASTS